MSNRGSPTFICFLLLKISSEIMFRIKKSNFKTQILHMQLSNEVCRCFRSSPCSWEWPARAPSQSRRLPRVRGATLTCLFQTQWVLTINNSPIIHKTSKLHHFLGSKGVFPTSTLTIYTVHCNSVNHLPYFPRLGYYDTSFGLKCSFLLENKTQSKE